MPRLDDIYTSKYLKVADLQNRKVSVTIDRYSVEKIGDDKKLVLYFTGKEKGLVTNVTNARMIEFLTGTDDLDRWVGLRVTLKPDLANFQGKPTPCIRIDSELPAQQTQQARPAPPPPQHIQETGDSDIPF